ncbi:unnamed protein product [Owenia fusiformis]|uniref:Uncharacterized protein n=1 Tax=Owenia fusiformis TaxID=6347 RepID=A0A8J1TD58_OWEFU|nr:unnamed protein product [Owenia fusiformis]
MSCKHILLALNATNMGSSNRYIIPSLAAVIFVLIVFSTILERDFSPDRMNHKNVIQDSRPKRISAIHSKQDADVIQTDETTELKTVVVDSESSDIVNNNEFKAVLEITKANDRTLNEALHNIRVNGKDVHNFLDIEKIIHTDFYKNLSKISRKWNEKRVNTLTLTGPYLAQIFNWLVSAHLRLKEPIGTTLLVTPDKKLKHFLDNRNIDCIWVDTSEFMPSLLSEDCNFPKCIWHIRLMVWRSLNHLGFDVVNYDSDALPLLNPNPLFNMFPKSDIIGAKGNKKGVISQTWTLALNMGCVLFKSSLEKSSFWEFGHNYTKTLNSLNTDQGIVNYILYGMNTTRSKSITNLCSGPTCSDWVWEGTGNNGLKVTILSKELACRAVACKTAVNLSTVTVWHPSKNADSAGDVWFLKNDWQRHLSAADPSVPFLSWLSNIANFSSFDLSTFNHTL